MANKKAREQLAENAPEHLRLNSFFAGIGGFDIGFKRAGIHPAFHCEINDFCLSILRRHWPATPTATDIRRIDINNIPEADVWCGGFPCQDVSVARGSKGRDGLKGKNTGLFYPFLDLLKQRRPNAVVLENVTGLLSSHHGLDFKVVITSLAALGYAVAWRVMNARYFGAPQSRPRVFICAWMGRPDLAIATLYEEGHSRAVKNARQGFITPSKCKATGASVPLVGYCLAATSGRHTGTDWSRTYVAYYDKVRRLTPPECEGLQGFPPGWTLPKGYKPLSDDEIDTLRYHALGNAVCVPVVAWIASRVAMGLHGEFDRNDITLLPDPAWYSSIVKTRGDFKKNPPKRFIDYTAATSIRWGNGGIAFQDSWIDSNVSQAPHQPIKSALIDIIEKNAVDNKYYLSPNAATGILRRVNSQKRTLFKPLHDALEKLSKKDLTPRPSSENGTTAEAALTA